MVKILPELKFRCRGLSPCKLAVSGFCGYNKPAMYYNLFMYVIIKLNFH